MKRQFMYIEDVKTAININTLEERITFKRWLIKQLQLDRSQEKLTQILFDSLDNERLIFHNINYFYKII